MPDFDAARRLAGPALAAALADSRERLWRCVDDLDDAQWQVPPHEGLNPIAWELGHVAWFAEFWILRGPHRVDPQGRVHAAAPDRLAGPDVVFDSSRLPHADRWRVALPSRRTLRAGLDAQLDACLAALPEGDDDEALYFHRLALFHEDMHAEALTWLRDRLGYAPPAGLARARATASGTGRGMAASPGAASDPGIEASAADGAASATDAAVAATGVAAERATRGAAAAAPDAVATDGAAPAAPAASARPSPLRIEAQPAALLGWPAGRPGFAFDNEHPGRRVALAPFEIDAAPLVAGRFRDFVEDGGYRRPELWPGAAGAWLAAAGRTHPERWRPCPGAAPRWEVRSFDRWEPLDARQPAVHLSAFEAEAFCRWAGRRLPRAAEWEVAARREGFAWGGSVWEWTADDFRPYPGFRPGPYRDYSLPWFGSHRELRGGAAVTARRMHHPAFRNFFEPHRADVFAGFRTAAAAG